MFWLKIFSRKFSNPFIYNSSFGIYCCWSTWVQLFRFLSSVWWWIKVVKINFNLFISYRYVTQCFTMSDLSSQLVSFYIFVERKIAFSSDLQMSNKILRKLLNNFIRFFSKITSKCWNSLVTQSWAKCQKNYKKGSLLNLNSK